MGYGAGRAILDTGRHHHKVTAAVNMVERAVAVIANDETLDVVTLLADRTRLQMSVDSHFLTHSSAASSNLANASSDRNHPLLAGDFGNSPGSILIVAEDWSIT